MSDIADKIVAEALADPTREGQRVSFTVPNSGRRYTIWYEDWLSICTHVVISGTAANARGNSEETKNR